jgi:hypothetical protein
MPRLTLPLLLYRIQLMRNLNCSSLDAGAMTMIDLSRVDLWDRVVLWNCLEMLRDDGQRSG